MISRLLAAIARHFADDKWMYDMRHEEVFARRAASRMERKNRHMHTTYQKLNRNMFGRKPWPRHKEAP